MSDIDLAVTRCKRLETLLERRFGASGRGLHEKAVARLSAAPTRAGFRTDCIERRVAEMRR